MTIIIKICWPTLTSSNDQHSTTLAVADAELAAEQKISKYADLPASYTFHFQWIALETDAGLN